MMMMMMRESTKAQSEGKTSTPLRKLRGTAGFFFRRTANNRQVKTPNNKWKWSNISSVFFSASQFAFFRFWSSYYSSCIFSQFFPILFCIHILKIINFLVGFSSPLSCIFSHFFPLLFFNSYLNFFIFLVIFIVFSSLSCIFSHFLPLIFI